MAEILEAFEQLPFTKAFGLFECWFCSRGVKRQGRILKALTRWHQRAAEELQAKSAVAASPDPDPEQPLSVEVVDTDSIASEQFEQQEQPDQPVLTENEVRVHRIFLDQKAIGDADKGTSYIGDRHPRWGEIKDIVNSLIAKGLLVPSADGHAWRAK